MVTKTEEKTSKMGTNDRDNDTEENKSKIGRFFGLKKKKNVRKKLLSDVLDVQRQISERLASFSCDNTNLHVGIQSTSEKVDKFNQQLSEIVQDKNSKEIIHELCNQLHNTKVEEKSLSDELKKITSKVHQREIELCKIEAENKDLIKEVSRLGKLSEKMEEFAEKQKHTVDVLNEQKLDLHLEIQKQENTIQDLKSNSSYMAVTVDRLSENIKEHESRIQEMKEEKLKLMEYSTSKCKMYEDRLKLAWVKFNNLRQERDALMEFKNSVRNPICNTRESEVPLIDETKVLQLELKLYRRDRLIEMLAEKLKTYESGFSLLSDPNLVIYLDQDWYKLAVDSGSEQGCEVSSVSSSTQSSTMSCDTDGPEMHI